jgi:hypothetical protein
MSRALVAALFVAAMVSGCGGSPAGSQGEPVATPSGTTSGGGGGSGTESDLEAAARAHFQAFADDDDDAYFAGLSDACRSTAGFGAVSERNNTRQGAIRRAGIDMATITVADVDITAFTGSTASVALTLAGTDEDFLEEQPNPWVFEGGTWHWDNCDVFASGGGGGGTGSEGSGPENAIGVGFPTRIADWSVYSTYLNANANELVAGSDGPASPPSGTVFFTWGIAVKYDGPDASSTLSDVMSFRLVAGSTTYDDPAACGGYVGALDLSLTAKPGEGLPGDICRAVATGDVGSLFLVVTEKPTGTDVWFGQ